MPGLVLAIEPSVTVGRPDVKPLPDRWTIITKDHTIACTDNGPEVLTA